MDVCTIAELYDRHGLRLYRYALLILADATAAEDVVQDAFYRLALARRRLVADVEIVGYLTRIVRNEAYSVLRRRRRAPPAATTLLEPISPAASEEERMVLNEALRALPPEQREVIYLKVFEGLTFQDIGARCGISLNTAASRHRYALAALRTHLQAERSGT
jgi:RNA polymerase sigma-70 factor (ECF subfamily)